MQITCSCCRAIALACVTMVLHPSLHAQQSTPAPAGAFPEGAQPAADDDLRARLKDKVVTATTAAGDKWRIDFRDGGTFWFNAGQFADKGKWSVKDGKLCMEGNRIRANCNEVALRGGDMFYKRDSGEVVQFMTQ